MGSPISLMAWTQLEELKQQQKLDRQKEQEKKRKLDTNPGVKPSNLEPVKEVRLSIFVNESSDIEVKTHTQGRGGHASWTERLFQLFH